MLVILNSTLYIFYLQDCSFLRNPNTKERPTFNDIMLLLLQNDKTLLTIPEDALSTHPQAGILGATLKAREQIYMNIQRKYMDTMDTAL